MTQYQPIENYGVIGDLKTAALVGLNGSIDFFCYPDFDSPTVFAALLDKDKGGFFQIHPIDLEMKHKQMYIPDTNVLLTRFLSEQGVGELVDFMPVVELSKGNVLIRRVKTIRGHITYKMRCQPRFNYGRSEHRVQQEGQALLFISADEPSAVLRLSSTVPLQIEQADGYATFHLEPGQEADFLLETLQADEQPRLDLKEFVSECLLLTVNYWKSWIAQSTYDGRWREMVDRSALVLKLLVSHQYGSIIAAPTFGLPEKMGGDKNWDYRYTWIRDAAFTVYALLRLGYGREARDFITWVEKLCCDIDKVGYLKLMYTIRGETELTESELTNFAGYRNSTPVRIGNAASEQLQLDIYGELMDSIYLFNKYVEPISHDFWQHLQRQIDWVCNNWQRPDYSIWEERGRQEEFLYSRLMCWVAIDRSIKIAQMRSFPLPAHWLPQRDQIYASIFTEFWNEELQSFVQYKGASVVDASTLLMPLVRFIAPKDPRWLSTLKFIEEQLSSDSLVYRYRAPNHLPGAIYNEEGTFSVCTFWFVECLSRAGQLQKARFYFEKMMSYANHLGLYSEQLGFQGEHLGNFPQSFTHLGLISAAFNLNKNLNNARNTDTCPQADKFKP